MTQLIIYKNSNGNVSVTAPTGEIPIEDVLIKDCPLGAIIVDSSALPQGSDAQFFDAWELNETTVTVNFEKAKSIKLEQYNSLAIELAKKRQLNILTGIENIPDDATWLSNLSIDRISIASATSTAELVAIANPA